MTRQRAPPPAAVSSPAAAAAGPSWRGALGPQVLATAEDGLVELSEIFGLEDWDTEMCVACMEEPRDTILLPCRHLCVCSECFDLLTPLDRCPVCRTAFASYLRFSTSESTTVVQDARARAAGRDSSSGGPELPGP